jgi:hypothetical protein
MSRLFGLVFVVLGIWAMTEVYLHGTEGAFGGLLGSGEQAEEGARSLGLRAGDSVERARAEADARTERMLEDEAAED